MSVLEIPAAEYHEDRVGDVPTLSASAACTIIQKTPLHAFTDNPRLNPHFVRPEEKTNFELGTAAHELLLEGYSRVHVVEHENWTTNLAKKERDDAREAGQIPMLRDQWDRVSAMVDTSRAELAAWNIEPPALTDGKPEQTLTWTNEKFGVACRCRPDWLRNDRATVEDVKTSAFGADPLLFSRKTIYTYGYDLRAAMYLDAVKTIFDVQAEWRWIVLETKPPFLVSVVTPSDDTLAIGHAKYERALEVWRDCLESGLWPGYGREIHVAEPPAWETRWLNTPELEESAWSALI